MNTDTIALLDKYFDLAITAPDGIKRLRETILTLAMQGKLVPQDPKDQPASELLKEIETEKQRLVKEGKIKEPKALPPIMPKEVPYEVPKSWEWVRIRDVGHDWGQKEPQSDFTYIDVGSIDNTLGKVCSPQVLSSKGAPSRARKIVRKGTVIYSTVRPYLLNIAVIEKEYSPELISSTAFAIIHPYDGISNWYIYHYFHSQSLIKYVEATMKGVAYPAINDGDFFQALIPLPSLAEQRRIVAKIDELMARVDELELKRDARNERRHAMHQAAVARLLDAGDANASRAGRDFIFAHFGEIYGTKENVAELRKAILQLAVMGRLVPQDPKDQPASELLKEIEAEKKRLVQEGKKKEPKPLPPIKPEEVPYQVPKGWVWVRLGDISSKIHYGYTASANENITDVKLLRITDIQDNKVDWKRVPGCLIGKETIDQYRLSQNDILIARTGGTVGKTYLVKDINVTSVFASYLIRVVPPTKIDVGYLKFYLESPLYWQQLIAACSGTGQPNVNGVSLSMLKLSLPPLAEQKRITAKVDELMGLCDTLEKKIDERTTKESALLEAVAAWV